MIPGFTPGQGSDAERRIKPKKALRAQESLEFVTLSWNARGRVCNEQTVQSTDGKSFIS
jgi:hypothetical protein